MVNLNKIYLINIAGDVDDRKPKLVIIIMWVFGGIIIAITITIIIIYIIKCKRKDINKKIIKNENHSNKNYNGLELKSDNRKIIF